MKKIYEQVNLIAHRGLSNEHLENTMPAFLHACKLPFYGIETDIQFTLDNKIICFHDKKGKRLLGIKEKISSIKYKSVKKTNLINTENIKYRVCTFPHYLKVCKKYKKHCIIELKYKMTDSQLNMVLKYIKKFKYISNSIIISFNKNHLKYLRDRSPNLKLQLLITTPIFRYYNFCTNYNIDVSINSALLNKDLIAKLKSKNISIATWTVNKIKTAKKLIDMGVEYITTDILM